jgi:hypothetical protein
MDRPRLNGSDVMGRKALAVAGALALTAVTTTLTMTLSPGIASAATGQITGYGGKCVDIAGASSANGTPVQLYDCNGTTAQQWTPGSDGTLRALGKCLDVTAAGTADGTKVQLYDCNGTAAQSWTVTATQQLINTGSGKCLDATDWSTANGTQLQIWSCTGAANQQWSVPAGSGGGNTPSAPMAVAPYLYEGWGSPPNPADIMSATGVKWFTLAFVLSNGTCNPQWDGSRPLTGGVDQSTVNAIRAAGGDVIPSFGGYAGQNMGNLTVQAAEGLKNALKNAYGYSDDTAYRHSGISSMNGVTDQQETVTVNDFTTILNYATTHHLARLTFWSDNRDRPCTSGVADSCSGVSQQNWDYTKIFARYTG